MKISKETWKKLLQLVITVLTTVAGMLGVQTMTP
ncbi:MAG: smalltalk protein [Bacteroidaceae bacterium]|nr:smalltalk protein [Bacteroidaceae bacterium]